MRYQRDISSTLKILAVVLILFVGYQVWLKPTYISPSPTADQPPPETPSPSDLTRSDLPKTPTWDVPPSRLLELGAVPNTMLGSIREELDRGNYDEVERRLKTLSPKKLTNAPSRQYVGALWNNLGVQQEKFGGTTLSVKAFKQAVTWDPANPLAHLNLTQAYWELRDPGMTPQFLETVIRLAPEDPFPHLALADLLLAKGHAGLAAKHLELARARAERDPDNRSYLHKLLAQVPNSEPAKTAAGQTVQPSQSTHQEIAQAPETPAIPSSSSPSETTSQTRTTAMPPPEAPPRQPAQLDTTHFTVQFDGPPDQATWTQMRAILEYAYDELSQKFGQAPSKPIMVVLHTNQPFVSAAGSPLWTDTLFDRTSGAIHLPTQGALEDLGLFSRIARHQFVHALLFEHVKGVATVPNWLIEGLAVQLPEDPWADIDEGGQNAGAVIPLTSLQGEWKQLSGENIQKAYVEAKSATQLLLDSYGIYGVRQFVNLLRTGRSIDTAIQQKFSVSYDQFQRQWEQTYQPTTKPGSS